MVTRQQLLLALALLALARPALGQGALTCKQDSLYQQLDFWTGHWNVFVGDTLVGTNTIEKVLDGCAVEEHWRDATGGEGLSLFYVEPKARRWQQVWVTARAREPGGLKEKRWLPMAGPRTVRFQGEIALPDGRLILDRTTLSQLDDGRVRQLIEISRDGGSTWRSTFDAVYRRQ